MRRIIRRAAIVGAVLGFLGIDGGIAGAGTLPPPTELVVALVPLDDRPAAPESLVALLWWAADIDELSSGSLTVELDCSFGVERSVRVATLSGPAAVMVSESDHDRLSPMETAALHGARVNVERRGAAATDIDRWQLLPDVPCAAPDGELPRSRSVHDLLAHHPVTPRVR